jgi:CRISPR system Cascade subunit CasA
MSVAMANMALFTLQTNAPSGGSGNRTGLRGGGPLTTLILAQKLDACLWQKLWLNVINKEFWRYDEPDLRSALVFPWLAETKLSNSAGTEIFSVDVHPLHMYWAMPRRIRLVLAEGHAVCQLSGEQVDLSVSEYRAKNHGGNYKGGWQHPLTPYKRDPNNPEQDSLSLKGQPGGITYKILSFLLYSSSEIGQKCAQNIQHYYHLCSGFPVLKSESPRLWAFAYDMDNMKPRGWYSNIMPFFSIEMESQDLVLLRVKELQKLAADALWQCRTQIKTAWFERPVDAKGDFSFIDLAFWQRSETAFFVVVEQLITNDQKSNFRLTPPQAKTWLKTVCDLATDLFDEYALAELGSQRSIAKKIKARQALKKWLTASKIVKDYIQENNIHENNIQEKHSKQLEVAS